MSAFQTPVVTKTSIYKTPLLYTSPPLILPLRPGHAKKHAISTKCAYLRTRCAFDASKEISTVSERETYQVLSDAIIVTVKIPLDVYLEETTDGRVFIDEFIPGGNGETSGLLQEGDVIVAVSLPFGEGLFPVPTTDGLDMIASHIDTREDDIFKLAIVRTKDVQELRRQITENQHTSTSISEMRHLMNEVHSPDYPFQVQDKDDLSTSNPSSGPDLEALRDYGFNFDDIFNSPDHEL